MSGSMTLHPDQEMMVGDETYHLWNPLMPAQPLHPHRKVALSEAEKTIQGQVRHDQKENSLCFMQELNELRVETEIKIRLLSAKYTKKETFIRDHILDQSTMKTERKINLFNAEVSMRAKELRAMGKEGGLGQARTDVLANRAKRNGMPLAPEREAEVLKHAEEQRYLKNYGVRKTNLSATKDVNVTVARIESEIQKLNKRTGASAILIVSRGHLNDTMTPTAFESTNASGFCQRVLRYALSDIAAKLESWSMLASQGDRAARGAKDLRKKCVSALHDGLCQITGKDDVAMNYQNYESAVMARYKVHLIGWPSHIPFANPSSLKVDHLQRLADALDSCECRWQAMGGAEIRAHNAQRDMDAASGKVVGKMRKQRSDKQKKRARGDEGASAAKKQRVNKTSRQLPPHVLSREYISDSDPEDDAPTVI